MMVAEVNKLIIKTLIIRGSIHLPQVGTLYIKRSAATTISRSSVTTPRLDISFSTHLEAISLIDEIASAANIGTTQANDIYQRWLDKTRSANRLVIEGLGILNNKSFIADKQLLTLLNPHTTNELTITRNHKKRSGKVASFVAVIILFAAIAGYYLYDMTATSGVVAPVDGTIELQDIPPRVMTTPAYNITADNDMPITEEQAHEDSISTAEQQVDVVVDNGAESYTKVEIVCDDWRDTDVIRHYLVVGSYSTEENVERAISLLEKQHKELKFSYFKLGTMYAVAAFGSAERDDCEAFKSEHRDLFKQSWIYTPRKYRE